MSQLSTQPPHRAGARERRRRAEALARHREERRTASGELAQLRAQLRVAAHLNARLASARDSEEMVQLVVGELHDSFSFYLAAVSRCEGNSLRLVAARGRLAEVMEEFLLVEQPIAQGVNGRVARSGTSALVDDTREDPDYVVRDAKTDPLSELCVPVVLDGAVWGVLNIEAAERGAFSEADVVLVEAVAASLGSALHRAQLIDELEEAFTNTLAVLTSVVEAKDDYTANHGDDVAQLAHRVASRMGLAPPAARDVLYAALLHDVGKIAVPSEILLKPGPLNDDEWKTMRGHAAVGGELVARIDAFAHLAPAVRASHERWDGGGYPDGLRGEAIPLAARIIAACDTYDAIVTDRPYRAGRSREEALAELLRVAGSQLDEAVVRTLVAELGAEPGSRRGALPTARRATSKRRAPRTRRPAARAS
jgi:HD-GYP domain-containing protein (c-di-GMP phosphodiesterase class II)